MLPALFFWYKKDTMMVFDITKPLKVTKRHHLLTKYMNFLTRIKEKRDSGKLSSQEYKRYKKKALTRIMRA